jgi:DNA polymerase III subunit delta'
MRFQDIPGNNAIKNKLRQAVTNGKVAHAQLFLGREGALNLPLAIAFATYIHCQNRTTEDACGACPACSKNLKYIHPDTNFVFPLGNIKGSQDDEKFKSEILKTWRAFLTEQPFGNHDDWTAYYGGEDKQANISREEGRDIIRTLSLKAFESTFKVMIIWLPEYMHPSASNGLLKILEEPPPNTFFLLVSNAPERLLPTILSRLQTIQVPLLADEELAAWLAAQGHNDTRRVAAAVQLAEGNINVALGLMESEESHLQERFANWMRACYKKEYGQLTGLAEEFHEEDKMAQRTFLQYSLNMLRETLLNISGASAINRTHGGELKFIQDFSKVMNVDKIDRSSMLITESSLFLERNGSAKMIFLDMSLKISAMF